jgi:hypothetical protein
MVITYFAVSFAYLPAIIKDARDEAHTPAAAAPAGDASAPAASAPAANASPSASSADKGTAARDGKGDSGGGALFGALMLAVSLPVLMIVGGSWFTALMLAIALYQAWQTNIPAKFAFAGPFRVARPAPAPAEA